MSLARRAMGHFIHMLQDFYTHSNRIELGNKKPHPGSGTRIQFGLPVADPKKPTCKPCKAAEGHCKDNLITKELASGYFSTKYSGAEVDTWDRKIGKSTGVGKCSHGGSYDASSFEYPTGGDKQRFVEPAAWTFAPACGHDVDRSYDRILDEIPPRYWWREL